jgi:hypothetical protein
VGGVAAAALAIRAAAMRVLHRSEAPISSSQSNVHERTAGAERLSAAMHEYPLRSSDVEQRSAGRCLWCSARFGAHGRGAERRFCSGACRTAFHSACRNWAAQAVYDGRLTLGAIRNAPQKPCTPVLEGMSGVAAREVAETSAPPPPKSADR